jgi:hypothetical protein
MNNEIGVWIDRSHAVMVLNLNQEEEIKHVTFNLGKTVQSSVPLADELNRYYDDVISYLRHASSILILGRGKAKAELQKRLMIHGFDDQTVVVKTANKMSDRQITAEVRKHFQEV